MHWRISRASLARMATMIQRIAFRALLLLALLVAAPSQADWLDRATGVRVAGDGLQISCAEPKAIEERLADFSRDARSLLNTQVDVIEALIRHSADEARRAAKPMPRAIRERLTPYFPPEVLDEAVWTTRSDSRVTLDSLLLLNGGVLAVTLDQVIVFRGEASAADVALWAHELVHIAQYRNMGVAGFATAYLLSGSSGLEKQAYDWAAYVAANLEKRGSSPSRRQYYSTAPGWSAVCRRDPVSGKGLTEAARPRSEQDPNKAH